MASGCCRTYIKSRSSGGPAREIGIHKRNETVWSNRSAEPPLIEIGCGLRGNHLLHRFPGANCGGTAIAHCGEHHKLLLDFLKTDNRPEMAGDDLRVLVGDFHDLPGGGDHAIDRAA